ncbi:ABC transporter substrate-binding protein [Halosimplex rubrum]|uniref:ABC transporter substrate-binding protein n=1 Tax=Halosimplex rubrum TaxID=869889 RepID=A0A7D5SXS4_9EURY|nr:ABC transporter substrate-binding protein [Halosimplex rubrum]QLH77491.1 ABC transporter substrate-binding protein [Halosimplex rubrum]
MGTTIGLLAGCTGDSGEAPTETEAGSETAATNTETSGGTDAVEGDGGESATQAEDGYTVSMEPMGPVTFDGPPEDWVALLPSYADMGIALDAGQTLGIQLPYRYASHFYDELPGVEYDPDAVTTLYQDGVDKERIYELDADVHFMEPNQLIHWYGWDEGDVEEIASNVGPFFGNFIRRRSDAWHDYPYYSLYGAFRKIAKVFDREERYRQFKSFHDEFLTDVQERLPEETPEAALLYPADEPPETFYPYQLYDGGVGKKQWRDLRLRDAFEGTDVGHYSGDTSLEVDFETLLDIDPDVLLIRGQEERDRAAFEEHVVEPLADHALGSELTAVRNGSVYQGGYLDQGPIINLFQTELAAQRIFADEFSEDRLFDRQRLANIITGET